MPRARHLEHACMPLEDVWYLLGSSDIEPGLPGLCDLQAG